MPSSPRPNDSRPSPTLRRTLAAALALALPPLAADAATIVVTSPDDSDTAAIGTCTLRQAIMSMDVGGLVGACHKAGAFGIDDTLMFAASALNDAVTPGTVTLADSADPNGGLGGTLVISASHLTIDGNPWRGSGEGQYPDGVTIARPTGASNQFGIIRDTAPAGGELVLKGIAIRNGYAWESLCGGDREGGGICMVAADLLMSDSRVSGNRAAFGGGGISSLGGALGLTRCTIDANVAYLGGGVRSAAGTVTVTASTISGNGEWAISHGGGIRADGTLAMIDSAISGNTGKRGAGLYIGGTATLTRSVVGSNDTYYDAGGIFVSASGTLTLDSSTIAGNHARYNGGGLYVAGVLNATNSTIAGNGVYRSGGGIALAQGGTLHLGPCDSGAERHQQRRRRNRHCDMAVGHPLDRQRDDRALDRLGQHARQGRRHRRRHHVDRQRQPDLEQQRPARPAAGQRRPDANDAARRGQRGDRRDRAARLHASRRSARHGAAVGRGLRHRRGGGRGRSHLRRRLRRRATVGAHS